MNLDFTNLRKITGGDAILESELFQIFLDSSKECLMFMRQGLETGDETLWRTQAHAFKGISFSIGADELGRLCKDAQENYTLPPEIKSQMLIAIEKEYAHVARQLDESLKSA
jgi:HPt (histidine-containing phosphotransfer) domain-containing protein